MLPEICEMEGLDKRNSSVRQLIIRVRDQLKAGEISLIDCTPEESEAAKVRLDDNRKKRRARHTKNKDQENAKPRARKKAHAK